MEISKFTEKLNKLENNIYTVEEEVTLTNGLYEGMLEHDNVNKDSINIYTGSMLTGDKISNYFFSTPSETPWKYFIKIIAPNVDKVYITYETIGDKVEAEDINNVQNEIVRTQQELNAEINRAKNAEEVLTNNLNLEINRAKAAENDITDVINTNKPIWDDKYTKNETDNKISAVVTGLDYKEHVATFADLSTTYPNPEEGWTVSVDNDDITYKYNGSEWVAISANSIPLATSSVDGKMSKEDKAKLDGVEEGANNYVHPSTHPASMIQQDSTHRFVSDVDIANWNNSSQSIPYVTATGSANAYAVTLNPAPTAYTDGMAVCIKINVASTGASTLNVNGLGAKSILDSLGNPITSGGLKADLPYTFRYNGTNFIVQGKGGGGDATAAQVLLGKKATVDSGLITGTLDLSNLVTGNIKSGITINGVTGKSTVVDTADAVLDPQYLLTGSSGYDDGVKKVGTMINRSSENWHQPAVGACVSSANGYGAYIQPPRGFYDGSSWVRSLQPDLIAQNIIAGKNIFGVSGGIPLLNPSWGDHKEISSVSVGAYSYNNGANYAYFQVPSGNYLNGVNWISHYEPYLFAQYIVAGASICGVGGSATVESLGGVRKATGSFIITSANLTYTFNLSFSPAQINYNFQGGSWSGSGSSSLHYPGTTFTDTFSASMVSSMGGTVTVTYTAWGVGY